jgi:hypothetical protein
MGVPRLLWARAHRSAGVLVLRMIYLSDFRSLLVRSRMAYNAAQIHSA